MFEMYPDVTLSVVMFAVDETTRKGKEIVSKELKFRFVLFEVNAAVVRFVVVMAFETYRFPVI